MQVFPTRPNLNTSVLKARFRDLSRSTYGFQSRSIGTQRRRPHWPYLLEAHVCHVETYRGRSR